MYRYIITIVLILTFSSLASSQTPIVYNLCDYLNNDTTCATPNNCQLIPENTCHPQADCSTTGLCYSKLTGDRTAVTVDNFKKSCQEPSAFTVDLIVEKCTSVDVFGTTFVTRVTINSGSTTEIPRTMVILGIFISVILSV